ncbi:mavicyanin-like [Tripterygium wilfordii]|uniref:mavicyanin-like n=1 Tax=Tripterygium wilfordii TaxID=458696 RepID=UPI0018F81683|nr:mavicyanin-like [Tripterygium wilfordii]
MDLKRRAVILDFMVALIALCGSCSGSVHKVGDSIGWTAIGIIDILFYKKWSFANTFHVGDTIVFEYNKQYHNVIEVISFYDFHFCNTSSPVATYSSGNDSITLNRSGDFYYTCASPGHCQAGQKVHIFVHSATSMGPIGSPTPGPSPSPSLSTAPTPF